MRRERMGDLDVSLVGPDAEAELLVVLLHGYGAPATDLVGLADALQAPAETAFAFPGAPLPVRELDPSARAWWPVDVGRLMGEYLAGRGDALAQEDPPGLAEAREQVVAVLAALRARALNPRQRLVLGGFSQGSMLATDVVCRSPEPLAGLVVMSGMTLAEAEWTRGLAARRSLPVFQSHGTLDLIVPYAAGQHLRALLDATGLAVDWVTFSGGHGIPNVVLAGLGRFLARLREAAPAP